MDAVEGALLVAAYASSVSGDALDAECARRGLDPRRAAEARRTLVSNGLMKPDYTLTRLGRESLQVVLTGGVFDIIHPGHIHTFNAAKKLGDVLVVVVATDETAARMKRRRPLHNQEQRRALVDAVGVVDLCVVGHQGDMFQTVRAVMPDVVALGYDQAHQEKFISDGCRAVSPRIQVARLQSPVPDISSSNIEAVYGDDLYRI
ncbi:MAG: FAD synthase [Thaumarchaeota archaeon]|nr:FAD synthase [Nitrososphaerota archaeon]